MNKTETQKNFMNPLTFDVLCESKASTFQLNANTPKGIAFMEKHVCATASGVEIHAQYLSQYVSLLKADGLTIGMVD